MKNLKFRTRLYVGFSSIILLGCIICVLNIYQQGKINKNAHMIYEHPFVVNSAVRDISIIIYAMHRSMKDVALAENEAHIIAI